MLSSSSAAQSLFENENNLIKSGNGLILSERSITNATNTLTFSAKAGTIALQALSIAGNMVIFAAIGKTISVVAQSIDNWIHRSEKAKETATELTSTLESSMDSLKSQKDLINHIEESYEKLSNGVDSFGNNISLSKEDFSSYQNICNEIAAYYPQMVSAWTKEGDAVVDLKNKVNDLKTAYEENRIAALNAFVSEASDIVKSYNLNADHSSGNGFDTTSGYKQQIAALQAYLNILKNIDLPNQADAILELMEYGGEGFSGYDLQNTLKGLNLSEYELDQIPNYLSGVIKNLQSQLSQEDNSMKQMLISMFSLDSNDYENLSDQAYQLGTAFINSFGSDFFTGKSVGDYRYFIDNLLNQLTDKNAYELNLSLDSLVNFDEKKESLTVSNYKEYINKIISDLQEYLNLDINEAESIVNGQINKNNVVFQDIDTMVNNVKSKLQDEFDNKVGELTLEELQIAAEQVEISEGDLLSWDALIAKIRELQDSSPTPDSFSLTAYQTQIDSFLKKTETLRGALEKLNSGSLSGSGLIDLEQEFPELADKGEGLRNAIGKLAQEELAELLDTLGESAPKDLVESLEEIAENISDISGKTGLRKAVSILDSMKPKWDSMSKAYEDKKPMQNTWKKHMATA